MLKNKNNGSMLLFPLKSSVCNIFAFSRHAYLSPKSWRRRRNGHQSGCGLVVLGAEEPLLDLPGGQRELELLLLRGLDRQEVYRVVDFLENNLSTMKTSF